MSVTTVLRVSCDGCDRNLVDVSRDVTAHHSKGLVVKVTARPGVQIRDYLPDDSVDLTYSLSCRCGRQHDLSEARLRDYWREHAARPSARVVRAVVGRDL